MCVGSHSIDIVNVNVDKTKHPLNNVLTNIILEIKHLALDCAVLLLPEQLINTFNYFILGNLRISFAYIFANLIGFYFQVHLALKIVCIIFPLIIPYDLNFVIDQRLQCF